MTSIAMSARTDLWVGLPDPVASTTAWATEAARELLTARGEPGDEAELAAGLELLAGIEPDPSINQRLVLIRSDPAQQGFVLDVGVRGPGVAPTRGEFEEFYPELPAAHIEEVDLSPGCPAIRLTHFWYLPDPEEHPGRSKEALSEIEMCTFEYQWAVTHPTNGTWRVWAIMSSPLVLEMVASQPVVMELLGTLELVD